METHIVSFILVITAYVALAKKDNAECEVCMGVLSKVIADMPDGDISSMDKVNEKLREFCGGSKGKENKFCFYIGALPESATSIINEVSRPLSYHKPVDKVCHALKTKDQQICELKYDKQIDWKTVDLSKLRVKELKKILDDWGERCKGCTEKSEYINLINELKSKYVKSEL